MKAGTVNKSISIQAPLSEVWDTLTNHDLIKLWLSENEINVRSDWKAGSPIIFEGTWKEKDYEDKGTIVEFEHEKLFSYTFWSPFSMIEDLPENYSVVTFKLASQDNKTVLNVIHSNLKSKATHGHAIFYWTLTLTVIKDLVEKRHSK